MPGTAVGLIFIDFIVRPFAKIYEKMPVVMIGLLVLLYAVIAFMVLKSAYMVDER